MWAGLLVSCVATLVSAYFISAPVYSDKPDLFGRLGLYRLMSKGSGKDLDISGKGGVPVHKRNSATSSEEGDKYTDAPVNGSMAAATPAAYLGV